MDNYCKICFKKIEDYSLFNYFNKNNVLCEECFGKLKAKFIYFTIAGIKATAVFEYTDFIKELIYKFKGCSDYELKDAFLYRYLTYLRIKYKGYYLVCAPSYHLDDEKRGFNHVEEIFKALNLKMLHILKKKSGHKQSDQSFKNRRSIHDVIYIQNNTSLKDKKILLADDIMTTGSTLLTSIELLKGAGAKTIKVLVIAKTKKKPKTEY